jgi:hypothetical protein
MKITLSNYSNITPTVKSVCLNNASKPHKEMVSLIAVASYAPVIVACYYYIEHLGYTPPEVQEQIDSLMAFYKYEEIIK